MKLPIIALLLYTFFAFDLFAESSRTTQTFQEYIDEKQKVLSNKVINLFDSIDRGISRSIGSADNEKYCEDMEQKAVNDFFQDKNSVDEFFKNDKYTSETEKSYLRVSIGAAFESKNSTSFIHKVRAQVPLSRTKESFKLFIDDVTLAEIIWVLKSVYLQKSKEISALLYPIIEHDGIVLNNKKIIVRTLKFFATHNLSYIDCYLYCLSKAKNIPLATFDTKLTKLK